MESTFYLKRTCVLLGKYCWEKKKIAGLARTAATAGALLDVKPLLDGAMAFSEELCPLVSLHCFAF